MQKLRLDVFIKLASAPDGRRKGASSLSIDKTKIEISCRRGFNLKMKLVGFDVLFLLNYASVVGHDLTLDDFCVLILHKVGKREIEGVFIGQIKVTRGGSSVYEEP